MDDLITRLRALARAEHSDLSVAAEAADELDRRFGIGGELLIARRQRDELNRLCEFNECTMAGLLAALEKAIEFVPAGYGIERECWTAIANAKNKLHSLFDGSDSGLIEEERKNFEADAEPYGFDLTRHQCAAPEPWSEYADAATGHRWGGWLAARALPSNI